MALDDTKSKRPMRPTTKKGGDDPLLASLRQADCHLSRATRVDGPRRIRGALQEATGFDDGPTDDEIATALQHKSAVEAIEDRDLRRVVTAAMATHGCRRVIRVREIAAMMGLPVTTTHRLLKKGLMVIRRGFDLQEAA